VGDAHSTENDKTMAKFEVKEIRKDVFVSPGKPTTFTTATGDEVTLVLKRLSRFGKLSVIELLTSGAAADADRLMLRSCVTGWDNVQDENGKPIKFSYDHLDAILGVDEVLGKAVSDHLFESHGFGDNKSEARPDPLANVNGDESSSPLTAASSASELASPSEL